MSGNGGALGSSLSLVNQKRDSRRARILLFLNIIYSNITNSGPLSDVYLSVKLLASFRICVLNGTS